MITLLNGEVWEESKLLEKMYDDDFYYNYLETDKALSSSSLKKLLTSPKKFLAPSNLPQQALRDGSLIHLHLLEPEKLDELVIVDSDKRTKAYKEAALEHGKDKVFSSSEVKNAYWIAKAVQDCDEAMELLEGAKFEVPGVKMYGDIAIRGKADALKGKTIIDVKSTADISKFKWSAKNFNYSLQAALYLDLFDAEEFVFLVVDKDTRDVGIFECSEYFLNEGFDDLERSLESYKFWFLDNDPTTIKQYVKRAVL